MNAAFVSLALILCFFSFTSGEPPVQINYKQQKKLRSPQKVASYVPHQPADSPTNFGFVPVKTADNYAQKEPLGRYVYPDLLREPQTYTAKYPQYQQNQVTYNSQVAQYTPQQTVAIFNQPITQREPQQYVYPQQYIQQYIQPTQEYAQNYVYQAPQNQPQYYYQPAIKNINHITDNNVPQYVYLQQAPESSNNVENVVDPKEQNVRYIMFVPTYVPQQQQQDTQSYYVTKQTAAQDLSSEIVPQPEHQVQYVYNTESTTDHGKDFRYKKEPTSLLDSYIPSIVQIQYYKRLAAQAHANQITDGAKYLSQNLKKKTDKYER